MPRSARRSVGGIVYHVLNRANSRKRLSVTDKDYLALFRVLVEAHLRFPGVEIFALCIMPNHWHLVLRASRDGELSRFMRWLTQTHAQRWRHAKRTVGHGSLYQDRFKSFVVEEDRHFLVLCRYVERNATRAKLARRAEQWRWGSAWIRECGDPELRELLSHWPVERPRNWTALLNQAQDERDEQQVRTSMKRGRPLGGELWMKRMVDRLKLRHTLNPPGRPRKRVRRRTRR